MAVDGAVVRRTQLVDVARSVPLGVLLPLETSVLLTVAIKRFDAPGLVKGLIAAASGVGLLASPFVTALARRTGRPVMRVASAVTLAGVVLALVGTIGPLPLFVVGSIGAIAAVSAVIPLMTLTYDRNFPAAQRGKRVGIGLGLKVGVSALAGLAMGRYLDRHLAAWWAVLGAGAAALAAVTWLQTLMPSTPLAGVAGARRGPWPHVHLLAEDRTLRLTLGAWMLMGFGNLMLLPLRVEYLARPRYGINADAAKITLLTVAVPSVVRLASMPVFGVVFDRLSFFASRIVVNLLFAAYVAAFFTGTSDAGLLVGAVVLGIGSAGGDLMWSLWVTKFAPRDRVADYMGLHTFSTGIRAVSAPLVGFAVIARLPLGTVAVLSVALMVASAGMLVPQARAERAERAERARMAALLEAGA